ncbi:uncharacterized protein LOC132579682 isoform X2 [Heteronotia binoei]|uniref:uncharacterized protein LOC132579682 isoform X2 n=1 Tax=Heteronotia binoei TaxID=13085 RepID=UPI002931B888|nr:uncharacterized protein LOC132579682 isoform X2 [Heteronotia binoei]
MYSILGHSPFRVVNLQLRPRDLLELQQVTRLQTSNPPVLCYLGILIGLLALAVIFTATNCYRHCKRCLKFCWKLCLREEQAQPRVNIPSSRVLFHNPPRSNDLSDFLLQPYTIPRGDPPPYSLVDPQRTRDLPPPYPGQSAEDPQGIRNLTLPYSEGPVVAFHHSRSQAQDDTVVLFPVLVAPPEAAASGGVPKEVSVTGSAPDKVDKLEAAATGTAREEVDWPEVAATGGAPEEVDWPEAAATGGAPEEVDWPEVAASGGAPKDADLEVVVSGGAPKLPE